MTALAAADFVQLHRAAKLLREVGGEDDFVRAHGFLQTGERHFLAPARGPRRRRRTASGTDGRTRRRNPPA